MHNKLYNRSIIDKLRKQIYIINNLKINIFIDFNILNLKKIMINYYRK